MIETSAERAKSSPELSAWRLRWLELALVLAVAFAGTVFSSMYLLFHNEPRSTALADRSLAEARIFLNIIRQATCVALLFYVLFRQGRSIKEIGFRWNLRDLPETVASAVVLAIAAMTTTYVTRYLMANFYLAVMGHKLDWHVEKMPVMAVSVVAVLFMILNGAFEELIVRAYAITEVEALTKNTALAVAFSVILQTSYHFYQGAPYALSYLPLFLVFAVYYVRTRDITTVVLAHISIDMLWLFLASVRR